MRLAILLLIGLPFLSCSEKKQQEAITTELEVTTNKITAPSLIILGTIQDAGSPHIACKKECCASLFENPDSNRQVVSLGIVDPENDKIYLFEATPSFTTQVKTLMQFSASEKELPDGIFLTHAHIGHYTGLMYLGKEATNANEITVYAMPRMKSFLENNGPWSQLVSNKNIELSALENNSEVTLTSNIKVVPFIVPHRDEYSETVGYKIIGPNKSVVFIPDIDKWQKWELDIVEVISKSDYAFIDATFYSGDEINTRDISEIPHPFIIESMALFESLPASEKNKIHFIHFNHTNPVVNPESEAYKVITGNGFHVAQIYQVIEL